MHITLGKLVTVHDSSQKTSSSALQKSTFFKEARYTDMRPERKRTKQDKETSKRGQSQHTEIRTQKANEKWSIRPARAVPEVRITAQLFKCMNR